MSTALVFGGTNGIGKAVAFKLASLGVSVTIIGRDRLRGEQIAGEIGGAFYQCDASLVSEVRRVIHDITNKSPTQKIDMCVFSQGIATIQGRTETAEGIDVKMALHYYGRIAAALELSKLNALGENPEVMFVLSGGAHKPFLGGPDWELKDHFSLSNAANACGFYTDVAVHRLAQLNPTMRAIHAFPGFVKTAWGTEMPGALKLLVRAAQFFATPADKCAAMLVDVLRRPIPGAVISNASGRELRPKPEMTQQIVSQIWAHTERVLSRV